MILALKTDIPTKTVLSKLLPSFSHLSPRQSLRGPGNAHIKQSDMSNQNNSCDLLEARKHHNTRQAYVFYTIKNSTETLYSTDKEVKLTHLHSYEDEVTKTKNAQINRLSN